MDLGIVSVRAATGEEWDKAWRGCEYATFFQSRAWHEIWKSYKKGLTVPAPLHLDFSDGMKAILPLSRERRLGGLINKYLSSPAGTYGGWISADPLSARHASLLADFVTRTFRGVFWRLNPFDPLISTVSIKGLEYETTHALLTDEGFEAIERRWRVETSILRKVRKARAAGITVAVANTPPDWKAYYELYGESIKRWGRASTFYEWPLFESLRRQDPSSVRLWLASSGYQPIAGAICLYARHHVSYWHGAALSRYFEQRPVNLLMHEIVRDTCERRLRWFDFNPSGRNQDGVVAFKRSFHPRELVAPVLYRSVIPNWIRVPLARFRGRSS